MKILIIIRGLPGSGKSTLATMIDFYHSVVDPEAVAIHEADQYFVKDGVYFFNPLEIPNAHRMCYNNTSCSDSLNLLLYSSYLSRSSSVYLSLSIFLSKFAMRAA